jgi:t-SNARE complex subunit (syntaxin)
MSEQNKQLKSEKGNVPEVRIRENQHAALSEQFFEVMTTYNEVQLEHKEAYKENLVRLVKVAVGDQMSEGEIKHRVDHGEIQVEKVFAQRLDAADAQTVKVTYNQVKETFGDLVKLEHSMEELHEVSIIIVTIANTNELLDVPRYAYTDTNAR